MRPTLAIIASLAVALIAATAPAQVMAPVAQWTFDDGAGDWQATDPPGPVSVTTDANAIRSAETGAVLEYAYTPAVGTITALICPVPSGLAGGKSLHLWIKTTDYAIIAFVLSEADESRYMATVTSLPDRWQEIGLGLEELALTDDTQDENNRLDPEQVVALMVGDLSSFIAQAAQTVPFIQAPDLGPRMLWLDDVAVTSGDTPPRWEASEVNGVRTVRVDGFESAPLQWFFLAGKGSEIEYDDEYKLGGAYSLRMGYDLPADKVFATLTSLTGVPLAGMQRLSIGLMSEMPTMLLVELKERDESKYSTILNVEPSDGLRAIDVMLSQLSLGDDSTDENGRLDAEQLKELTIADVRAMGQLPGGPNTVWIDDVVFGQ